MPEKSEQNPAPDTANRETAPAKSHDDSPKQSPTDQGGRNVNATPIDPAVLVGDLAGNMPDVTPGVQKSDVPTDPDGTEFRPEYHATHPDGSPKVDKRGRFYPATSGRPKKAGFADPRRGKPAPQPKPAPRATVGEKASPSFASVEGVTQDPNPEFVSEEGATDPDARWGLMADAYLKLAYVPIGSMLGAEATPDEVEHKALRENLIPVLKLYQFEDMHPLIGFAACVGGVAIAKAQKPSVRERFATLLARFRKPAKPTAPTP